MNSAKKHILVVEDETDIRNLMVMHLNREGYQVTSAGSGEEGLRLYKETPCDLAILDWMLPGISGLELCKEMQDKIPILMVTARADAADIVLGLEMGADDYITKPFEIPVFLARVRALLRRALALSKERTAEWYTLGDLRLNVKEYRAFCQNHEIKLTHSEFKLLTALLDNKGRVLSRDKLVTLIQGDDIVVTLRTIDTHVFGLRKKLGACAELIETIRGVGYRVKTE